MNTAKNIVLKKLSLLSNFQKMKAILAKEDDKLDEERIQDQEKEEIQKIKISLKK
jgi:hypothetical protein